MNNKELLKRYYRDEQVTRGYDKQREGTEYRKMKRKEELNLFLSLLNKKKNDKVLELGCSSGFLTKELGEVTAIDTSKEMLKITKRKNPKAKVLEADMFELPFKANSFDKVVTMRVWNHLNTQDLFLALEEAKRVLKKRGVLVFDMEEEDILRKIVNFFYKKMFGIKGFKVYQYSFDKIFSILDFFGFEIEQARYLEHRIGKQIIIKAIKH